MRNKPVDIYGIKAGAIVCAWKENYFWTEIMYRVELGLNIPNNFVRFRRVEIR
jgi:hypothetical protein